MRAAGLRVLLSVVAAWCLGGGADALPDAWILLPVAAIANSTLIAPYDCHTTYTDAACAGHGDCYLLLDSADPASQPYMQAADRPPLPVNSSNLDQTGIDAAIPLPTAVCLCHSGYTGRADYIDHDARDGDSCAVSRATVRGLAATGCVLFSILGIIALFRLCGWYAWHHSKMTAIAAFHARPPTPKRGKVDVVVASTAVSPTDASTSTVVVSPLLVSVQPMSGVRPLDRMGTVRAVVHPASHVRTASTVSSASEAIDEKRRRRTRLLRHIQHESFVHPACALALSLCSLAYFILRLTTTLTIGDSYIMSAIIYVQHVPYIAASCLGVAGTLQLAASIAKLKLFKGADAVAIAKKCLIGLCLYQSVSWLGVFLLAHHHLGLDQQLAMQLFLLLCLSPDFLLGPITVLAVLRINRALLSNLESLSVEQQQQRRSVHDKMRKMTITIAALTLANSVTCLWLVADSRGRQAGLPYYAFVWHYSVFVLITVRLLVRRPPRPMAAVCPMPQHGSVVTGGAKSYSSSVNVTPASSRRASQREKKSMGGLHLSAGSTQPPHSSSRRPKLVETNESAGESGSVSEVDHGEQAPAQHSESSSQSVVSEG